MDVTGCLVPILHYGCDGLLSAHFTVYGCDWVLSAHFTVCGCDRVLSAHLQCMVVTGCSVPIVHFYTVWM